MDKKAAERISVMVKRRYVVVPQELGLRPTALHVLMTKERQPDLSHTESWKTCLHVNS